MTKKICNTDDVIDSRDVIARIEELTDEQQAFLDVIKDSDTTPEDKETAIANLNEWNGLNAPELVALEELAEDAEGHANDWRYGATLIRYSYFKDYAQELAEDIGAINANSSWPNNCIDWEQATRELQMDYTSVEFEGVTYWVR